MKWFRLIGLAIFIGTLSVVSGCKRDSGKIKVAFISNNTFDFWNIAEKGAEKAANERDAELLFKMPPQGGFEAQQSIIEDFLSKGVQGIAISPKDAENSQVFFKDHVSPKVPLITQDSDVPDPSIRRAFIGTDNYKAGWAAGDLVRKALPKGGKIAIFVGRSDALNAKQRRQGVLDNLADREDNHDLSHFDPFDVTGKKFGDYTLVATKIDLEDRAKCQSHCEDLLSKHQDMGCLIGLWEYNPPAMLLAVKKSKNATKPAIVGFDENYDTLDGIKSGHIIGTVVQDPYNFGYMSVQMLVDMVNGKKTAEVLDKLQEKHGDIITIEPAPNNRVYVRHRVITDQEVDEFYQEVKKLKGT